MNDDNIMACILFAKRKGLVAADDAAGDVAKLRAAVGRLEGERQAWEQYAMHREECSYCADGIHECGEKLRRKAMGLALGRAAADERGTG
jgi:hypothetical protein